MIYKVLGAIGLLLTLTLPASAQNTLCATRAIGDNSNACASTAFVQQNAPLAPFPFPHTVSGTVNSGGIPYFNSAVQMSSSATLAAGGIVVGGGSGGAPATITLGGDCTFLSPNVTCTKTNGVVFAPSATTDTTNATNITSGTLSEAREPPTYKTIYTPLSLIAGAL